MNQSIKCICCYGQCIAVRVVGIVHRQAICLRLLGQSTQAVMGITGDFAGVIGFDFLTAAGIVGVSYVLHGLYTGSCEAVLNGRRI